MKSPSKLFSWLFLGAFFWFFSFSFSKADGMLIPPPFQTIKESGQKAIIFFEENLETLIISIEFEGNAQEFAWVIPTPSKPEIKKSTPSIFLRLQEITEPAQPTPVNRGGIWAQNAVDGSKEAVTVLEEKQIEYYDIAVLEANNKNALYEWLNNNGYQFPESGKNTIDEYIQNHWIFTAVKINSEKLKNNQLIEKQLQKGSAIPLELKFKTNKIVYPLKVSSVSGMEGNAPEGEVTFLEGKEGKGVKLDSGRVLASDQNIKGFSINEGQIKFSLKKQTKEAVGQIVSLTKQDRNNNYVEELNINNDNDNFFTIQFSQNSYKGGQANLYYIYSVNLGSDFQSNSWQDFDFSWKINPTNKKMTVDLLLDGNQRILTDNNSLNSDLKTPLSQNATDSLLVIGGKTDLSFQSSPGVDPNAYRSTRKSDLFFDQLTIFSRKDKEKYLEVNFQDNLNFKNLEKETVLRVFNAKNIYPYPGQVIKNEQTDITLYIFADGEYEIPGFDVKFANWFTKKEIENFATVDGTKSWITPKKGEYFLTKLHRSMEPYEMTEDLYPQKAANQTEYKAPLSPGQKTTSLYSLLFLSIISVSAMATFIIIHNKDK